MNADQLHELVPASHTNEARLKPLPSPFLPAPSAGAQLAAAAPANNTYGLCSIQDFSGVFGNHNADLSQTHGDARGFYDYLVNFVQPNYWFRDAGVQTWGYEEPYDHWQNLYGVDSVLVFYHSGHGNMTATGVFEAPVGSAWSNETWIRSNYKMLLANQRSRYIFWSTCLSCRVGGGLTPISTWWSNDANPGVRMLFGFETVSVDSPNYGANFWRHWRNNESFSTAWLNASWDIDHTQAPSCVASGANQAEASDRLFNERTFNWGAVARNWYQWRWYDAVRRADRNLGLPTQLNIAEFTPRTFDQNHVRALGSALALKSPLDVAHDGALAMVDGTRSIDLDSRGRLHIKLGTVNHRNEKQLPEARALELAEKAIQSHGLHAGQNYQLDVVRFGKSAGGATTQRDDAQQEFVTDTTVQYRQVIDGLPVINSDAGVIRVTVDNDGTVTQLHSSVRKVAGLRALPRALALDPKAGAAAPSAPLRAAAEAACAKEVAGYAAASIVPGSEEVGYDADHAYGRVVLQRTYEVTMANGLKKRIKVVAPIFE